MIDRKVWGRACAHLNVISRFAISSPPTLVRQLKHEIIWKTTPVTLHRFVQSPHAYAVELSPIRVQHHLLAPKKEMGTGRGYLHL